MFSRLIDWTHPQKAYRENLRNHLFLGINKLQDKELTTTFLQLRWLFVFQVQVTISITLETNWGLAHKIQIKRLNMNKLKDE